MKKSILAILTLLIAFTYGCKKDLKVEGPDLGSGPVSIAVTAPTNGAVLASNSTFTFTGTITAPAGVASAVLDVFGHTYTIATNAAVVNFSVPVDMPENIPTGATYNFTITAVDFDDVKATYAGNFTLSQGLSAFIISPIAGISDPILAGLNGTFKMRLNYKEMPTSITLKINYSATNIQEAIVDLANTNEFGLDTAAGKSSYLVQKTIAVPNTVDAGIYEYSYEIVTASETVTVNQKVEVQKINTLWVLGDATTAGWNIDDPIALNNTGPNTFNKSISLDKNPKGFKFVLAKGSWAVNWGTSETGNLTPGQNYPLVSNGNNMMLADSGSYVLNVDFNTGMFNVTAFAPPDSLYLVGGSTPAGWDPNVAIAFTKSATGVFSVWAPLTVNGSGFKFLPNKGSWNGDWGQKPGDPGKLAQDGEENCPVTVDGFYRIDVNFNTMSYTTTLCDWGIIGSAIPPYNWSSDVNLTWGGATDPYTWSISSYPVQAGEFKFRANDAWTINFGDNGNDGSLEQDGANIPIAAGTWNIKLILNPNDWTYSVTAKKK
jgi:hypothetical protein